MVVVKKQQVMPYSAEQMYALVNDVEQYPEFIEEISRARVLEKSDEELLARVWVSKGPITESFVTRNRNQLNQRIEIGLESGPFSKLQGGWLFEPTAQGCSVKFELQFAIKSLPLRLVLQPIITHFADQMVQRFYRRAKKIYG